MLESTDINIQQSNFEPIKLVHEYLPTEIYIGTSNNGNDTSNETWSIKRIIKINDVWALNEFPDGNQSFKYSWDLRLNYSYK